MPSPWPVCRPEPCELNPKGGEHSGGLAQLQGRGSPGGELSLTCTLGDAMQAGLMAPPLGQVLGRHELSWAPGPCSILCPLFSFFQDLHFEGQAATSNP